MPTTSKARRCTFIIAPGDLKRWHGGTQDLPESLAESPGGRSAKGLHPNLLSPLSALQNTEVNGGSVEFGRRMAESLGYSPDHHWRVVATPLPERESGQHNHPALFERSEPKRALAGILPAPGARHW